MEPDYEQTEITTIQTRNGNCCSRICIEGVCSIVKKTIWEKKFIIFQK